jgi:acyl CoA:acetate/3-ketoacid CoA transferase alpha subunit
MFVYLPPTINSTILIRAGVGGFGVSSLFSSRQVKRLTASYVGDNDELFQMWQAGEISVELVPQVRSLARYAI